MKTVLSIAGTDPTGGAGIQADLKTIEAHGLYGMAAITVVIAQNTTGVFAMQAVSPELVTKQIDCVFEDIRPDAVKLGMLEQLFPLCTLVTPNLHETAAICGQSIQTRTEMEQAACNIAARTKGGVLVKGGHLADCADDLLCAAGQLHWLHAPRIDNPNTHGTGCTLSSAIACNLAQGVSLTGSVKRAKRYLTACIRYGLALGHGSGPLQHRVEWNE